MTLDSSKLQLPEEPTLYDALDSIWDLTEPLVFDTMSPVMIFSIHPSEGDQKSLDVPETLHLDRYLVHNEATISDIREKRHTAIKQLTTIESQSKNISTCQQRKSTAVVEKPSSDVLQAAIKLLKDRNSLIGDHEVDDDEKRVGPGDDALRMLEHLNERVTNRLRGESHSVARAARILMLRRAQSKPGAMPGRVFSAS